MSRRSTIFVSSLLALLLFTAPGWTFPIGHRGPSMGTMPMQAPAGAFVHSARGFFNPGIGSFTQSAMGTSRITSRSDIFVPTNGRFVPNVNGPFTMTTREAFNPATGTFTPAMHGPVVMTTNGNFSTSPRGFVQPASFSASTNRFVSSTTGTFNPRTETFMPRGNGASVLTSGNMVFVPSTGTFVPSANGSFALTTREAFNRNTGTLVPARNGPFVQTERGTFTPAVAGRVAPATMTPTFTPINPASFVSNASVNGPAALMTDRFNRHLFRAAELSALGNWFNPYGFGSFGSFGAGTSSYGGGGGGYGGGYGSGMANGANTYTAMPAYGNAGQAEPRPASPLAAFGVPMEFGEVKWPLAMRVMPPDTKRDLLDKLETQMKIAANQALTGNASQVLLRETKSTIDNTRAWLRDRRTNMSESTYQDGQAFLDRLMDSLRRMDT